MATKVLVFESDAAFAGELRNELGKLGCNTLVVDDGNVGLQQAASDRPDLILLSIELPRMNGFSVCNKLKKDPALKDVPLIIMSSESSEETFEQHRKLRTRAEDYVHKPIAFGELLRHIQAFVALGAAPPARSSLPPGPGSDGGIVIEDEISVHSADYVEDDNAMTQIGKRPEFIGPGGPKSSRMDAVDRETNQFAEDAFDMLTGGPEKPVEVKNGSQAPAAHTGPPPLPPEPPRYGTEPGLSPAPKFPPLPVAEPELPPPVAASPAPAPVAIPRAPSAPAIRPATMPPRAGVDTAEHERLKAELEKSKTRASDLEKELGAAKTEIGKLQHDVQRGSRSDADSQRMQREIDELKAKLATGAKGGGISSREFLDLREALNKKDKEILSLREGLTRKDKEQIESQDKLLAFERAKADLEDKMLATDRENAEYKEKIEAITADKDLAKKASEDFKARLERAKGDLDAKAKEIADLKAKQGEEVAAHEAARVALKADLDATLAREKEEHGRALEQAESTRKADLDVRDREHEAALGEARDKAARERADAIAAREAQLKQETDGKLAALHRAHQQELEKAKEERAEKEAAAAARHAAELAAAEERRAAELATKTDELEAKRAEHVAAIERDRDERIAQQTREHDAKVTELERERDRRADELLREHHERVASLENDRDSRIAALEARSARELDEARAAADAQKAAADELIARLEADIARLRRELSDLGDARRASEASLEAKVADLEQRLASTTGARDGFEKDLAQAKERVFALDAELASTKQELSSSQKDLADTRAKLGDQTARADKAFAKWDSDRASLERAKDALAVALAQIEDAESRSING